MEKCYLGIDIGSISTKGVIIDVDNNIIATMMIDIILETFFIFLPLHLI